MSIGKEQEHKDISVSSNKLRNYSNISNNINNIKLINTKEIKEMSRHYTSSQLSQDNSSPSPYNKYKRKKSATTSRPNSKPHTPDLIEISKSYNNSKSHIKKAFELKEKKFLTKIENPYVKYKDISTDNDNWSIERLNLNNIKILDKDNQENDDHNNRFIRARAGSCNLNNNNNIGSSNSNRKKINVIKPSLRKSLPEKYHNELLSDITNTNENENTENQIQNNHNNLNISQLNSLPQEEDLTSNSNINKHNFIIKNDIKGTCTEVSNNPKIKDFHELQELDINQVIITLTNIQNDISEKKQQQNNIDNDILFNKEKTFKLQEQKRQLVNKLNYKLSKLVNEEKKILELINSTLLKINKEKEEREQLISDKEKNCYLIDKITENQNRNKSKIKELLEIKEKYEISIIDTISSRETAEEIMFCLLSQAKDKNFSLKIEGLEAKIRESGLNLKNKVESYEGFGGLSGLSSSVNDFYSMRNKKTEFLIKTDYNCKGKKENVGGFDNIDYHYNDNAGIKVDENIKNENSNNNDCLNSLLINSMENLNIDIKKKLDENNLNNNKAYNITNNQTSLNKKKLLNEEFKQLIIENNDFLIENHGYVKELLQHLSEWDSNYESLTLEELFLSYLKKSFNSNSSRNNKDVIGAEDDYLNISLKDDSYKYDNCFLFIEKISDVTEDAKLKEFVFKFIVDYTRWIILDFKVHEQLSLISNILPNNILCLEEENEYFNNQILDLINIQENIELRLEELNQNIASLEILYFSNTDNKDLKEIDSQSFSNLSPNKQQSINYNFSDDTNNFNKDIKDNNDNIDNTGSILFHHNKENSSLNFYSNNNNNVANASNTNSTRNNLYNILNKIDNKKKTLLNELEQKPIEIDNKIQSIEHLIEEFQLLKSDNEKEISDLISYYKEIFDCTVQQLHSIKENISNSTYNNMSNINNLSLLVVDNNKDKGYYGNKKNNDNSSRIVKVNNNSNSNDKVLSNTTKQVLLNDIIKIEQQIESINRNNDYLNDKQNEDHKDIRDIRDNKDIDTNGNNKIGYNIITTSDNNENHDIEEKQNDFYYYNNEKYLKVINKKDLYRDENYKNYNNSKINALELNKNNKIEVIDDLISYSKDYNSSNNYNTLNLNNNNISPNNNISMFKNNLNLDLIVEDNNRANKASHIKHISDLDYYTNHNNNNMVDFKDYRENDINDEDLNNKDFEYNNNLDNIRNINSYNANNNQRKLNISNKNKPIVNILNNTIDTNNTISNKHAKTNTNTNLVDNKATCKKGIAVVRYDDDNNKLEINSAYYQNNRDDTKKISNIKSNNNNSSNNYNKALIKASQQLLHKAKPAINSNNKSNISNSRNNHLTSTNDKYDHFLNNPKLLNKDSNDINNINNNITNSTISSHSKILTLENKINNLLKNTTLKSIKSNTFCSNITNNTKNTNNANINTNNIKGNDNRDNKRIDNYNQNSNDKTNTNSIYQTINKTIQESQNRNNRLSNVSKINPKINSKTLSPFCSNDYETNTEFNTLLIGHNNEIKNNRENYSTNKTRLFVSHSHLNFTIDKNCKLNDHMNKNKSIDSNNKVNYNNSHNSNKKNSNVNNYLKESYHIDLLDHNHDTINDTKINYYNSIQNSINNNKDNVDTNKVIYEANNFTDLKEKLNNKKISYLKEIKEFKERNLNKSKKYANRESREVNTSNCSNNFNTMSLVMDSQRMEFPSIRKEIQIKNFKTMNKEVNNSININDIDNTNNRSVLDKIKGNPKLLSIKNRINSVNNNKNNDSIVNSNVESNIRKIISSPFPTLLDFYNTINYKDNERNSNNHNNNNNNLTYDPSNLEYNTICNSGIADIKDINHNNSNNNNNNSSRNKIKLNSNHLIDEYSSDKNISNGRRTRTPNNNNQIRKTENNNRSKLCSSVISNSSIKNSFTEIIRYKSSSCMRRSMSKSVCKYLEKVRDNKLIRNMSKGVTCFFRKKICYKNNINEGAEKKLTHLNLNLSSINKIVDNNKEISEDINNINNMNDEEGYYFSERLNILEINKQILLKLKQKEINYFSKTSNASNTNNITSVKTNSQNYNNNNISLNSSLLHNFLNNNNNNNNFINNNSINNNTNSHLHPMINLLQEERFSRCFLSLDLKKNSFKFFQKFTNKFLFVELTKLEKTVISLDVKNSITLHQINSKLKKQNISLIEILETCSFEEFEALIYKYVVSDALIQNVDNQKRRGKFNITSNNKRDVIEKTRIEIKTLLESCVSREYIIERLNLKIFNFSLIFNNDIEVEIVVSSYDELKAWLNGLAFIIKLNKSDYYNKNKFDSVSKINISVLNDDRINANKAYNAYNANDDGNLSRSEAQKDNWGNNHILKKSFFSDKDGNVKDICNNDNDIRGNDFNSKLELGNEYFFNNSGLGKFEFNDNTNYDNYATSNFNSNAFNNYVQEGNYLNSCFSGGSVWNSNYDGFKKQ